MAVTRGCALALLVVLALAGCGADRPVPSAGPDRASSAPAPAAGTPPPSSPAGPATVDPTSPQVLVTGLDVPWGLAFLPDGDALVSERDTGRVLRVPGSGGNPQQVTRIAQTRPGGEGGLMGLAVSPRFSQDQLVYAYVTAADDNRIIRFRLDRPEQVEEVLTGIPKGRFHNGGRIAFGPDGHLYAGTGYTDDQALAQDDGSLGGKVLRMTPDGDPVAGGSVVFSTGHRNVQGLAFDDDGRLYAVEFGAERFDEVNVVSQGSNGGWPHVEGPGDGGGRFLAPVVTWPPEEASPSGGAVLGQALYVAALRGQRLWRVPLDGRGGAGTPEPLLVGAFGRLRTVQVAPDGSLWVLTSNRDGRGEPVATDDRVVRLPPG